MNSRLSHLKSLNPVYVDIKIVCCKYTGYCAQTPDKFSNIIQFSSILRITNTWLLTSSFHRVTYL